MPASAAEIANARRFLSEAPAPHDWRWLDDDGRITSEASHVGMLLLRKRAGAGLASLRIDIDLLPSLAELMPADILVAAAKVVRNLDARP